MKTRKNRNIFTIENYKSGDGMLTTVWGPSLWHSLHTISFNYPVNPTKREKKNYKKFILDLKHVLPCKHCRENLSKYLEKHSINNAMKNRNTFSLYIYKLHENVNKLLNKNSGLSYNNVRERYEHFRSRCKTVKKVKVTRKNHKGCTIPLHKFKSKGIIKIVPNDTKCNSLEIDKKCNLLN